MLTETHNRTVRSLDDGANEALNIFIIYDDPAASQKAKETCDVLAGDLGSGWEIDARMCSFDSLSTGLMRQIAATAAMKSHIVVVSCSGPDTAPHVFEWIESSLHVPTRPMALVLLAGVSDPDKGPHAWQEYLAALAQQRGMQFFHNVYQRNSGGTHVHATLDAQKESDDSNHSTKIRGCHACSL